MLVADVRRVVVAGFGHVRLHRLGCLQGRLVSDPVFIVALKKMLLEHLLLQLDWRHQLVLRVHLLTRALR